MHLTHGIRISDPFGPAALTLVPPMRCRALSAAFWVPPRYKDRDEVATGAFGQSLQMIVAPERLDGVTRVLDGVHSYHPLEPCWYLPFVGVDPRHQGQGCSAKLMKCALAQCNAQGLPSYLESSNPDDITLYERHGFKLMGRIQSASSPPVKSMYRMACSCLFVEVLWYTRVACSVRALAREGAGNGCLSENIAGVCLFKLATRERIEARHSWLIGA